MIVLHYNRYRGLTLFRAIFLKSQDLTYSESLAIN